VLFTPRFPLFGCASTAETSTPQAFCSAVQGTAFLHACSAQDDQVGGRLSSVHCRIPPTSKTAMAVFGEQRFVSARPILWIDVLERKNIFQNFLFFS